MATKRTAPSASDKAFGKNLQRVRKNAQLRQEDVATKFKVTVQAVSGWERGASRPDIEKLAELAELYGVELNVLLGTDRAFAGRHTNAEIPVISHVQAGNWTPISDPTMPGHADRYIGCDSPAGVNAFALEITGTSMLPRFSPGDVVVIDPDVEWQPGDFVVAKLDDQDEATFKEYRLRSRKPLVIELRALNEAFGIEPLSKDNPGRIVGTMIEHHAYRRRREI